MYMLLKPNDLTGPALDLAVAHAEGMSWWLCAKAEWDHHDGYTDWILDTDGVLKRFRFNESTRAGFWEETERYTPSTDWSQGGPIIDREFIGTVDFMNLPSHMRWRAHQGTPAEQVNKQHGPTALIAAMRCFVASKLGDEFDPQR